MANEWRIHVKKTMEEMKKAAPKGVTIMLKDVLKKAKTTYKKSSTSMKKMVPHKKTAKKHHKKKHGKKHGKKSMKKRRRSGKK